MRRRENLRDPGLRWRMYTVMLGLVLVYLFFVTVMLQLGVPIVFVAVLAGVMLGSQYYFSDTLVLRSMHAKVKGPTEAPKLHGMVDTLIALAEMTKPKIAVADMDVPNAFATGRNAKNAVVCVTTGLMSRLNDDELYGVLAHELSHIKNNDVTVMTIASFFATLAAMLMNVLMWMSLFGGLGHRGRGGGGGAFIIAYIVSMLVYFVATLLILALSRYREFGADYGGAMLSGKPSSLASALMKITGSIAKIPTKDLRTLETANAFCIASALRGENLAGLMASHPPVGKRVERLQQLSKEMERR